MSLLTYSGITTKVRAMQSHLLTDRQFQEMAALESVQSAADYLKHQPAYADIFDGLDDDQLHRGHIEQLLNLSKYRDFSKLYRFANLSQRKFLDLYFMHYEIEIIKTCLRNVMAKQRTDLDLSMFQDFFDKHSRIDVMALSQAQDLAQLAESIRGSIYYPLFLSAGEQENRQGFTVFDYELPMDLLYFKTIWKEKDKVLTKQEARTLEPCFGSHLDLLNIQWIYRSKKYYALSTADIYALLIPIQYRLKPEEIKQMAEAPGLTEFFAVLEKTHYGEMAHTQMDHPDLEAFSEQIQNRIYHMAGRKHPYSMAILDSYLYFKEQEKQKLITTIEGIRYGLGTSEIVSLVLKMKGGSDS